MNKTIASKTRDIEKLKTEDELAGPKDKEAEAENKAEIAKAKSDLTKQKKFLLNKLKTLATRLQLFMYLTDYREETLQDIIIKLEPELFERVTGVTNDDFKLLVEIGLFDATVTDTAVCKFSEYEDSSTDLSLYENYADFEDLAHSENLAHSADETYLADKEMQQPEEQTENQVEEKESIILKKSKESLAKSKARAEKL